MIVGETALAPEDRTGRRSTLDDLFRRAAVRYPDAIALVDPSDRTAFTDGEPRTLTFAQADRIVWAIAGRLRRLGLQTDAVVAIHLPNTVESVLTLLGVIRAGLIAAPLPMLWRQTEIIAALSTTGAKAFITTSRLDDTRLCDVAMMAAAQLFSIRHVCAFGRGLPDGIVPLDDLIVSPSSEAIPPIGRGDNPAAHAAVVTFEPTPRDILPVLRNHAQLIAGGLPVPVESGLSNDAALLSATPLSSFAGLSVTLLPWLLSGGRLVLHQPFNVDRFALAQHEHGCEAVVAPGPLVDGFNAAGQFDDAALKAVIALWRAPEREFAIEPWQGRPSLIDVRCFGETGLVALRRGNDGLAQPLPLGVIGETEPVETRRSRTGTLTLRGGMVASSANLPAADDGFADTCYPCRTENGHVIITGAQPGMVGIGGYRFARAEIDTAIKTLPVDGLIAALPDALTGQRLRGRAGDPAAAATLLAAQGANPLLSGAFGGKGRPSEAA
jgi:hypothetical protein